LILQAFLSNWNDAGVHAAGAAAYSDTFTTSASTAKPGSDNKDEDGEAAGGAPDSAPATLRTCAALTAAQRLDRAIAHAMARTAQYQSDSGDTTDSEDLFPDYDAELDEVTIAKGLEKVRGEMENVRSLLAECGLTEEDVALPARAVKECLFNSVHAIVRMVVCDEVR
jgi:hypothetical protein